MPWYKTGTVAATLNSTTVTGTGTSFVAETRVGDAFIGPDGRMYEITNAASATVMSISPAYLGPTVAAGKYAVTPIQGYNKDTADALRAASSQIASSLTSKADIDSPLFSGAPRAPTPAVTDNSTRLQTTAGSLQQMQAYGVGASAAPALADVDANRIDGVYQITAAQALAAGLPLNVGHIIRHTPGATATAGHTQEATPVTSVAANRNRIWRRQFFGTSWSVFVETQTVEALNDLGLGAVQVGVIGQTGANVPTPASKGSGSATSFIAVAGNTSVTDQATNQNPVNGEAFSGIHASRGGRPVQFGVSGVGSLASLWWRGFQSASAVQAEWQKAVARSEIIGTVSQAGGVPTGSIIERGSNSNGEYTKYADGTMICTRTVGQHGLAPNQAQNSGPWNFAATFVGYPAIQVSTRSSYAALVNIALEESFCSPSSYGYSMYNWNAVSVTNVTSMMVAVGRWF